MLNGDQYIAKVQILSYVNTPQVIVACVTNVLNSRDCCDVTVYYVVERALRLAIHGR